jgi:dynein heavy chain
LKLKCDILLSIFAFKSKLRRYNKGAPTKSAVTMWSGEKESVNFAEPCICDGPVETWLGSVVDSMRAALWAEFKTSVGRCC